MSCDMSYYAERLRCTPEEKRECLETVRLITGTFEVVRKNGLFALEDVIKQVDDPFFQACAQYIMDARDPDEIRSAYERMLVAGDYRGKAFLHNLLIAEGMLVIQTGERYGLVYALFPWFGAEWRKTVSDTVQQEMDRLNANELRQSSVCPEFDRLLELPVERRDALAKQIWACTRITRPDLFVALKHAGEPVRHYLLEGLTPDEREDVRRKLEDIYILWIGEEFSAEAQRRVLDQISADDCTDIRTIGSLGRTLMSL